MTKQFILFLFFISSVSFAQKIGRQKLEYASQLKNHQEKIDFFLKNGFVQEIDKNNENIKLVMKLYQKRTQEFDYEIIMISDKEIVYTLINPKKYTKFKKLIVDSYKTQSTDNVISDTIIYIRNRFTIKLIKNEINFDGKDKKAYNFSITNN